MADQHVVAPGHADSSAPEATLPETHAHAGFWTLMLGAIGVVFGDIGTSPLYAFKESVAAAAAGGPVTRDIILGVLSLILWSLVLVVTAKYVFILLRADNKGEGGTLTLVALAQRATRQRRGIVLMLGIVGAGLFYGDAVLTPAISVLSAVEGLKLVAPTLESYVVPITLAILTGLFLVQSRGTGRVAAFFGPVMLVWFAALALAGALHIADDPTVLTAINPLHSIMFFFNHPNVSLAVLGAVCLAVTGAEALYADLGHFGAKPIRSAWLYLVFPALVINYFGQGALVLSDPTAAESPLFRLVPEWALVPMIVLATLATIIASQAVITGAFSLTRQAVQLGIVPRLEIRFTSETHQGQIYLPKVNMFLLIGVIVLVLIFGSSSNLSHAYGVSVFGAMSVDAVLAIIVIWKGWRWTLGLALAVMLPFLFIDLAFLGANLLKIFTGGYVPVILASVLITLMWTWVKGTNILFEKTRKVDVPFLELVKMLEKSPPHRVKGTAVFLTSDPATAPAALLHNLKHNKVLHEKNVVLTVRSEDVPRVEDEDRVSIEDVGDSFWRIQLNYGYMETPNIPRGLAILRKQGFKFDIMATSFFLSRRSIRPASQSGMPLWQDKVFISLAKSASDATDFFQIPTGRVVEVGTQVTV
jgi:KUP system potassium uptake protein